ncbi:hypothetical protein QWM81_24690 [Streptomyces ficellus]|uniref:AIM24 family protein n=1 Tax=Streptomyces ficellus TaxID=1977088 RepID=A0ABT7ZCE9_9ACTN|nr:hypothetical protein [Streptomyces ficellus]MDN3297183.1 hypothetical protein [Streptomyces ficellus]
MGEDGDASVELPGGQARYAGEVKVVARPTSAVVMPSGRGAGTGK